MPAATEAKSRRQRRYVLERKRKAGKATHSEIAELRTLQALKGRKAPPRRPQTVRGASEAPPQTLPGVSETPPAPSVTPAQTPSNVSETPPGSGDASAAPPLLFDVSDLDLSEEPEPGKEGPPPWEPPGADSMALAERIVTQLVVLGAEIERCWGFPPLLNLDLVVIPALRMAWGVTIERYQVVARLANAAGPETAPIAAAVSAAYLGGGGLYAKYTMAEREKKGLAREETRKVVATAAAAAPSSTPPVPEPPASPPMATIPSPFGRSERPTTSEAGIAQVAVAARPPERKG